MNEPPGARMRVGLTALNYGGGTNWNGGNAAGLMMECLDNTEIVVHDNGTNIGIGITTPVYKTEIYSGVKTSAFTGLSISNFNNYDGTANSLANASIVDVLPQPEGPKNIKCGIFFVSNTFFNDVITSSTINTFAPGLISKPRLN